MTYAFDLILTGLGWLAVCAAIATALVVLSVWIGGERSNWKDPS